MTTHNNKAGTTAQVKPIKSISAIWLVPIIAIIIGAWMVYYNWKNQGPIITVEFKTAAGIESGNTKIKSLDVDIGQVTHIEIKPDLDGVIVTARLSSPSSLNLLKEDTLFWVVSPKVSRAGISGLHTLLSGPYIELYPGTGSEETLHFSGLENPPLTSSGTTGLSLTLNSEQDFSFTAGDPVIYKGFNVGTIEDIYFNSSENMMYYNAFIEAPYHNLISTNTRFWKLNGIELELTADGLKLQTGTLETFIRGGVTFDLPKGTPIGDPIDKRAYFEIYPSAQSIIDQRYKYSIEYVLLVDDSIRGLAVGAPVEFRGVKVGHVTRTDVAYMVTSNLLDKTTLIPVMVSLAPGLMGLSDDEDGINTVKSEIDKWIAQGLRASLKTGNLITGNQLVELQYSDNAPTHTHTTFNGYPVIPIVPNNFSRISTELGELLNKLNNLPIGSVAGHADELLMEAKQTLSKLRDLPLNSMVHNADKLLIQTNTMITKLDSSIVSLETILTKTANENIPQTLNNTMKDIQTLAQDFSKSSANYDELNQALRSINDVLLDLKPLMIHLKNQPNSLIFGSKTSDDLEPKREIP